MRYTELVDRPKTHHYQPRSEGQGAHGQRKPFHHPHTSLGAAGHWIHLLAIAAPLVIGEVIKDPEHRWRALRIASVGAAMASEAVWTYRLSKDKKKDEEAHEALEDCQDRCR
jgi:hypothetical protein